MQTDDTRAPLETGTMELNACDFRPPPHWPQSHARTCRSYDPSLSLDKMEHHERHDCGCSDLYKLSVTRNICEPHQKRIVEAPGYFEFTPRRAPQEQAAPDREALAKLAKKWLRKGNTLIDTDDSAPEWVTGATLKQCAAELAAALRSHSDTGPAVDDTCDDCGQRHALEDECE